MPITDAGSRADTEIGADDEARAERFSDAMRWIIVASAVCVSAIAIGVAPSPLEDGPSDDAFVTSWRSGAGILAVVAVALAALPLAIPRRAAHGLHLAGSILSAAGLTVLSSAGALSQPAALFLPTAFVAWFAIATSETARRGGSGRWLRILGAALTALPVVAAVIGALSGSFGIEPLGWILIAVLAAVSVLIGVGSHAGGWLLIAIGLGTMFQTMLEPGLLFIAFWWAGGLWIAVGLSVALLPARARRPDSFLTGPLPRG